MIICFIQKELKVHKKSNKNMQIRQNKDFLVEKFAKKVMDLM